jgi:hypothetical protein
MSDHWAIMPWVNQVPMTLQAVEDLLAQSLPTRVLLIGQGTSKEDREAVDQWVDRRGDHRVLCWSWNPGVPSLSACWNRALAFVWELGGEEALVVNNDVRLHRDTCAILLDELRHRTALFVSAVGVKEDQFATWGGKFREDSPTGGPDFSCFLISRKGHERYPFDESLMPAFTEDCCCHREYMLGGDGARIFSVNLPYLHYASQTIKHYTSEQRQRFDKQYAGVVARYTQLWGGRPNEETYTVKGDPSSAREGVTNPDLQRRVQAGVSALPPLDAPYDNDQHQHKVEGPRCLTRSPTCSP